MFWITIILSAINSCNKLFLNKKRISQKFLYTNIKQYLYLKTSFYRIAGFPQPLPHLSHDYCFLRTITNAIYNLIKNKILDRTNLYRGCKFSNRVNVVKNAHISRASAARGVEYKQRRVTLILYQKYPSFWRLKQRFPWQGKCHGVTKGWLRGTSSSNLWTMSLYRNNIS